MKQLSGCGSATSMTNTATRYQGVFSANNHGVWNSTEANIRAVCPAAGTLRNFKVNLATAPGTGKSWTFTIRKNGVDTGLTLTISDTNTTSKDTTHSVSVAAGDLIIMSVVPSGTPTAAANAQWTVEFEGNTSSQNIIAGGTSSGTPSATNINGTCPACGDDIIDITGGLTNELTFACLIPHATTIKALYIDLRTAPGSGKSWKFHLRKNGSKEATSEVTISNTATTGNVTGLSISLAAGDYITIAWEGVGTPTTTSFAVGWGILLESTNGWSKYSRPR